MCQAGSGIFVVGREAIGGLAVLVSGVRLFLKSVSCAGGGFGATNLGGYFTGWEKQLVLVFGVRRKLSAGAVVSCEKEDYPVYFV